jgi:uncharacterized protein YciI
MAHHSHAPMTAASTFAVIRSRGAAWQPDVPMRGQLAWDAHASFMNGLASDGFVVLGGPLGDGERTLLIVDATSEQAVRERLQSDPWTGMSLLRIDSITPWHILLSRADGARQRTA